MRRPTERCGGRGQAPGTAGQTRESIASVADHVGAGKQVAKTLHRRHLDESQRGMVFARLATLPKGANQHTAIAVPTQSQAAELLNVSIDTGQRAKRVLDHGAPELVAAAERKACEIRLRAERRTGELLRELARADTAKGGDVKSASKAATPIPPSPYAEALQSTGISRQTAQECIGDLNEAASMIFTGCTSILDAVSLRLAQEDAR